MTQFGFLAMFANAMPIAPIFCFITNVLEIRIKTNSFSYYSRRGVAEGASGIGAWLSIIEMLSIVCIPVNCAIIYFSGDGTFDKPGKSSLTKFLEEADLETWNHANIILFTILIEHLMILLKVVIGNLISDVPSSVLEAEKKRELIENKCDQFLELQKTQFGITHSVKTFRERVAEEEAEDAKIIH